MPSKEIRQPTWSDGSEASLRCASCDQSIPLDAPRQLCPICLFTLCLEAGKDPVPEENLAAEKAEFAGYELLEEIGHGAMGIVYRARQSALNRIVALKMLRPARLLSPQDLQRFKVEAEAIARLDHPNILPIFDSDEERGQPFYSTRFIEGGSLAKRLSTGEYRMSLAVTDGDTYRALERKITILMFEVAEAVQHAHDRGVLHRDLKPGNILIDPDGHPQISDFGLARFMDSDGGLTLSQSSLGTPAYMSPEQAKGAASQASAPADIYSLGAVLYEMLTGRPPFLADTPIATVHQILHNEPVGPRVINPRISIDLQTICLKCLEKEPHHRYGSAKLLADDLRRFLAGQPISARPQNTPQKALRWIRRNPLSASLASLVVLCLFIFAVLSHRHSRQTTETNRRISAANLELKSALDRLTLQKVDDRVQQRETVEAIALLAQIIRQNPSNRVAASRLLSVLAHRSFPVRFGKTARHTDHVLSAQFSPTGDRFVTVSADRSARVWDAQRGIPVSLPFVHPDELSWGEFSPDGRFILTSCHDGSAYIWNANSGQLHGRLVGCSGTNLSPGETGHVLIARFSPDGRKVVTAAADGSARIWDFNTLQESTPPMRHSRAILSVAFSPDSRWLLTGSSDRYARLWDSATGEPVADRLLNHGDVASVNFSPDGSRVITASFNGTARIWDRATGQLTAGPLTHSKGVRYATFSPDGRYVVTSSIDLTARIWDAQTGAAVAPPFRHDSTVRIARFSLDGSLLVTASDDGTARVWDARAARPLCEPLNHGAYVVDAVFSPKATNVFLTASVDGTARLWRLSSARPYRPLVAGGPVNIAIFSPSGRRVVTGRADGISQVWDAGSADPVTPPLESKELLHDAAFSPDETVVATASADRSTRLWEIPSGKLLREISGHGDVQCVAFSPDGRKFARGLYSGTAQVFDSESGTAIGLELKHAASVNALCFSPDGALVATASLDYTARFWNSETGEPVGQIMRHHGWVRRGEFSRDGRRFVTASPDGTAKVWDSTTGKELMTLRHSAGVLEATFDPSGRYIATGSADKAAWLWDANTGELLTEPLKHPGSVRSVRFGMGGRSLFTSARTGQARLWDVPGGLPLSDWLSHDDALNDARLSPDGTQILTASQDGTARLWEVPSPPLPVPDWLPMLAEAIAGAKFDSKRIQVSVDPDLFGELQRHIPRLPPDYYTEWFNRTFGRRPP